ncbi:MAG TPA: cupin domain-containing protein [Caulobacteraceae bacterium]|nr:cupin domain-containing protein [Caulobacteraceae bacterium]
MTRPYTPLTLAFAGAALAGSIAMSASARAGECPADQMRADARTSGETMPKDVTDNVLGAVPLAHEIAGLDGRQLRLRRLVVQPGGVVPWHSHADRPALIMTLSGSITEYRSTCAVGIEHPAGDVAHESGGISHWWRNNGKVAAVLIAADIKNDGLPASADHM